jgi:hypothetical protein
MANDASSPTEMQKYAALNAKRLSNIAVIRNRGANASRATSSTTVTT